MTERTIGKFCHPGKLVLLTHDPWTRSRGSRTQVLRRTPGDFDCFNYDGYSKCEISVGLSGCLSTFEISRHSAKMSDIFKDLHQLRLICTPFVAWMTLGQFVHFRELKLCGWKIGRNQLITKLMNIYFGWNYVFNRITHNLKWENITSKDFSQNQE